MLGEPKKEMPWTWAIWRALLRLANSERRLESLALVSIWVGLMTITTTVARTARILTTIRSSSRVKPEEEEEEFFFICVDIEIITFLKKLF